MNKKIRVNGVTYQQVNEVMGLGDSAIAKTYETISDKWFFLRSQLNKFVKEGLVKKSDLNDVDDSLDEIENVVRYLEKLGKI